MRRSPLEEGRRWLEQAEEDLKWVKDLADRGGYHIACFLAQQTAEKAMKAFIYAQGEELVLGHSVQRLCTQASRWKPDLGESVKRWAVLDSHYIPTRYPNGCLTVFQPGSTPKMLQRPRPHLQKKSSRRFALK